ncbi:hypothetical protein [Blastococcus brunescens]|uniref:Uncharacterized protein n=1 Tax=Blastococcus brunescens TaxID=1564165 RepID=A0ABZ1B0L3_9ACTN|nr:hypothetical protein [Blastococcus sp. BMG 8361]WRL64344.1 hypothetical protein U6N30_00280 [Blastococcus sp. BMG 8361]
MSSSGVIVDVAAAVDAAAQGPVLVIGTGPPTTPDLRLLVPGSEVGAIADRLQADGFLRWRSRWARFDRGAVEGAQLVTAAAWGLAPDGAPGADELFTDARLLPGCTHLALPAPHVVLVLTAHELLLAHGRLGAEERASAVAAGAADGAWDDAAALAGRLRLSAALRLLRRALDRPDPWTEQRRRREMVRALATHPRSARRVVVTRQERPAVVRC